MPKVGDELVSINGKKIEEWSIENFEFCKFPLRSQCEQEFWNNFRHELLSWYRNQPLTYTIKRNDKIFNISIPILENTKNTKTSELDLVSPSENSCGVEKNRYPEFKVIYRGNHACVFEAIKYPEIAILRIRSFYYKDVSKKEEIKNIHDETKKFLSEYWLQNSKRLKTLIIDVTNNGGGDIITSWTSLFVTEPFQDQWVQFKKILEMEQPLWQKKAFYEDRGKLALLHKWKKNGTWDKIKFGEFLPPMPQFCVSGDGDCLKEKWMFQKTNFKGKYIIFTDPWCISSCVGFVWTMKNYLKERVIFVGMPDSGDSTYSRANIAGKIIYVPPFYSIFIQQQSEREQSLFEQVVSVTRTTDEKGNIISGLPQKMNMFLSKRSDEDDNTWVARLLRETLLIYN